MTKADRALLLELAYAVELLASPLTAFRLQPLIRAVEAEAERSEKLASPRSERR